jgi:hypothetical protein
MRTDRGQQPNDGRDEKPFHGAESRPMERAAIRRPSPTPGGVGRRYGDSFAGPCDCVVMNTHSSASTSASGSLLAI